MPIKKGEHISPKTEFKKGRKSPNYWKGKKFNQKHKRNISLSMKGIKTWNKGKTKETDERVYKMAKKLKGRESQCKVYKLKVKEIRITP